MKRNSIIKSQLFYYSSLQSSMRLSSAPHILSWRVARRVFGVAGAVALLHSLNVFPDLRRSADPKHYYSNLWIRVQVSPLVTALSPKAGILSNLTVPPFLRESLYGLYVWLYGCRMDEAEQPSLKSYPTFAAFFNRQLKAGVRPISSESLLVSPADGTVLHFGRVDNGRVECVKGLDYEIHEFLGPIATEPKEGNSLFQVVLYLAPGDYHAFHSPANWRVLGQSHFPGFFQSVRPSNLLRNPKLLCQNERLVLSGSWQHGFFSMTAVAALFVGNIVALNERRGVKNHKSASSEEGREVSLAPGDKVGEFRMGSTVVLIFEAPKQIDFCIEAGQKLRYGQSLLLL